MPLDFNHAMIYSRNVTAAVEFYHGLLGLDLLETFEHQGMKVYARLRSPASPSSIAIHLVERGQTLQTGGVRLYFETRNLEAFCRRLTKRGAKFTKPPAMMPWGWQHAYLDDPDGHEVSLYWAGARRLKKAKA